MKSKSLAISALLLIVFSVIIVGTSCTTSQEEPAAAESEGEELPPPGEGVKPPADSGPATGGGPAVPRYESNIWYPLSLYGGTVSSLASDSAGNIYAGTQTAGIFKKSRQVWVEDNDGLSSMEIRVLLSASDYVYAGTNNGLYKRGLEGTWEEERFHERRRGVQCLVSVGDTLYLCDWNSVYRRDSGGVWAVTSEGLEENTYIYSLTSAGDTVYAGTSRGVYKEVVDPERRWVPFNNGLVGDGGEAMEIRSLVYYGGYLYTARGYEGEGLYKTTINDADPAFEGDWTPEELIASDPEFEYFQPYVMILSVAGDTIYAVTAWQGVYKKGPGEGWSLVEGSEGINNIRSFLRVGDILYAGRYGSGISKKHISQTEWREDNEGLRAVTTSYLSFAGGRVYASSYGYGFGLYSSNILGENWERVELEGEWRHILYDVRYLAQFGVERYAVTGNGLFKMGPAGNWERVAVGGMVVDEEGNEYPERVGINTILPTDRFLYLGANNGIYRQGAWEADWVYEEIVEGDPPVVTAILSTNDSLFAGTRGYDRSVFRRNLEGRDWTREVIVEGEDYMEIYSLLQAGDSIYAGTSNGLFKRDADGNWERVGGEEVNPRGAVYSLSYIGEKIYAGTRDGLYVGDSNGENWARVEEFEQSIVYSLLLVRNTLFAGTSKGIYLMVVE